nr:unnamed protein product [Callosobruchus analis]
MMSLKELEVLGNKLDSLDERDLMTLLKWFRFDEMLSISSHDFTYFRLYIFIAVAIFRLLSRFLAKLMYKEQFFTMPNAVKHSLEFVLTNILTARKVEEHMLDDFSDLLHILSYILKRSINRDTLKFVITDQTDRCFEAAAFGSTVAVSKLDCVSSCLDILSELLKNIDDLNSVAARSTAKVLLSFEKMGLFRELTTICCLAFSVSSEVFDQCATWFFTSGSVIFNLFKADDEDSKLSVLKTTNLMFLKLNDLKMFSTEKKLILKDSFKRYKEALLKVSSQLLLLFKSPLLRDEAKKLFCALFFEYSDNCVDVASDAFYKLPEDIEDWYKSGEMLFFEIVAFLCKYDRPCWSPRQIIESIACFVYSKRAFQISHGQMKTLSYVYPILLRESNAEDVFLVGDVLLILTAYFNLADVLTLHVSQLVWILTRADVKLKTATLHHWLKCSEDVDEIARVVLECKALCLMHSFIKNQDSEEIVCKR